LKVLIFILGAVIGSFINVCISRIPQGESVVFPPSHCPKCGYNLKPLDLVPLLSFILLKGRCRKCNSPISIRYLIVELLTGSIFVIVFLKFGLSHDLFFVYVLITCLIISAFIDLEYGIIPDEIIIPTVVLGAFLNILLHLESFFDYLAGFLLGAGIILFIAFVSGGGMGGGDVKLFAAVGIFLGLDLTILSILLAFISGSIVSIILIILNLKNIKDTIPFGPFIAFGSIFSLIFGHRIILWYLNAFF